MVQIDGRTVGLLVDAISDILSIDKTKIQPPPTDGLVVDTQYLDGLVATDDRMVALLNITKIFNADVIKSLHAQTTTKES
jgi:purine-binding chemotaxis protein CheW